jgi:hypothetical protein
LARRDLHRAAGFDPRGAFRIRHGSGAHAPNEYYLIDSTNPKVAGMVDATMGFVEFLYTLAAIK